MVAVDQAASALAIGRQERLRLLFADDDPLLREFATENLRAVWCDVSAAADGQEALESIARNVPDILLLDLEMPRVDGFAVLRALRADEATKSLPVIVITGLTDEASIERAFSAGATSFLTKPLNWRLLVQQIRFVNRSAQIENALARHVCELEQKKFELEDTTRALAAALNEADAASAAKSDFLATMSHELRTPLNAIIGFSEVLQSKLEGPLGHPKYEGYVGNILDSGKHLLSLVNDVLEFSRGSSGKLELNDEEFCPGDVIEEAVHNVVQQAAKAQLSVSTDPAPLGLRLCGDRRRIRQVLINLLANAVKFTPPGGRVTVRTYRDGGGVAISVSDTGIGIAPEDIPKALERFSQVRQSLVRQQDGAGLGLPLAKQLMELHCGSLTLESTPKVGTEVTIRFPKERVLSGPVTA